MLVQVTAEQRSHAKSMAYGLLYGKGTAALAADLETHVNTADRERQAFMAALPGLDAWQARSVQHCCVQAKLRV